MSYQSFRRSMNEPGYDPRAVCVMTRAALTVDATTAVAIALAAADVDTDRAAALTGCSVAELDAIVDLYRVRIIDGIQRERANRAAA